MAKKPPKMNQALASPHPDDEEVQRLNKDMKEAIKLMSADQVRYMVDRYYQVQQDRIRADHQARMAVEAGEPNTLLEWNAAQARTLEGNIRNSLKSYADSSRPGRWAQSIYGIGPVIAAGMIAHIDISRAKSAANVWRFAGLDPTVKWEKKTRRPWNAQLKVLCWKAGTSFMKFHKHDECMYGHIYSTRKKQEIERNERLEFADQAARALQEKKWRDDTTAKKMYEAGKLPDARIDARARRYAVKLFLAHLHHVMWESKYGAPPPDPYPMTILNHAKGHYIPVPNWPME